MRDFLRQHLGLPDHEAAAAAEVTVTLVSAMAERVTSQTTAPAEVAHWAGLVHRMLVAVLLPAHASGGGQFPQQEPH